MPRWRTSTCPFSELHLQHINPSTSPNELNTTLTPHSMIHGDACFAYFNKIWGILSSPRQEALYRKMQALSAVALGGCRAAGQQSPSQAGNCSRLANGAIEMQF